MQRVVVTGANRGLGLEFVRQLLARDARVFAACRHPGKALELTKLAGAHPGRLSVLPLELTQERSIAELVREVGALSAALDLLINNAGMLVAGERFGAIMAKSLNDTFASNAAGPFLVTQALAPLLEKGANAKVVNISSSLGSLTRTSDFYTPSYAISKAALNMATRQLAAELAPRGITVVCASPGWVQTAMGGATAPVTPATSVAGLLQLADRLGVADAGRFLDYSGAALPW